MKIKLIVILLATVFVTYCTDTNVELPIIMAYQDLLSVADVAATSSSISKVSASTALHATSYAKIGIFDTEKKFIKDGRIYYQVENLKTSVAETKILLSSFGGYLESEVENIRRNQKIIDLKLKVPNKYFESFLDSLTLIIGHYESRSVNIRDVTDQYIDTKVRIDNKKKVEQQYLELLKKAINVSDLLSVEEKLGKIREEIESAERRLFQLNNDIDYSKVFIKLYKNSPEFNIPRSYNYNFSFIDSVKRGWYGMIRTIYYIFSLWPLIIILTLSIYWVKKYLKRRKVKNKNTV